MNSDSESAQISWPLLGDAASDDRVIAVDYAEGNRALGARGGQAEMVATPAISHQRQALLYGSYLIFAIPFVVFGSQYRLTYNMPLIKTWDAYYRIPASIFSTLPTILFASWNMYRLRRAFLLAPKETSKQLFTDEKWLINPWFACAMPAMFVSALVEREAQNNLAYWAVALFSSICTNLTTMAHKPKRIQRLRNMAHLEKVMAAVDDNELLKTDLNTLIGEGSYKDVDDNTKLDYILNAATRKDCVADEEQITPLSKLDMVALFFFVAVATFQYVVPGAKAMHCMAAGLDLTACREPITFEDLPHSWHYMLGAVFFGGASSIVNGFILRRAFTLADEALQGTHVSQKAAAGVLSVFSFVFTAAIIYANEPTSVKAVNYTAMGLVPTFSMGLTFLSFLMLCKAAKTVFGCFEKKTTLHNELVRLKNAAWHDPKVLDFSAPTP